jgi:hypothetical protein
MFAGAVVGIDVFYMLNDNSGGFLKRLVLYTLGAPVLSGCLLCGWVSGVLAHDRYHADFYSRWVTREGISCCNAKDCEPIDDANIRVRHQGVEVYVEGEWVPVAPEKIRPYEAPDMHSHLCHMGRIIFCFVFGGGS